jgi:hypothetical protein
VDIATLVAECLAQLKGQLSELRRGHARGGGRTLTATFRAVTETSRTLKELARAAATLAPPAASAREPLDDDMDDARLDAICDELAEGYARWRARRLPALPAGEPGALPDP